MHDYDNFNAAQLNAELERLYRELKRTDIAPEERVDLSRRHDRVRIRLYPEVATVSSAIRDTGYFVGLSETSSSEVGGQDGPVGRKTPPITDEIAEATRKAHRARFEDQRLDELRATAGEHTRKQAEEWLGFLELQEASEGRLDMNMTEQECAAALLLREEVDHKAELADVRSALDRQDERLQRLADEHANTHAVELSEHDGPIYNVIDSHGAKLLCLDDSICNQTPNQ